MTGVTQNAISKQWWVQLFGHFYSGASKQSRPCAHTDTHILCTHETAHAQIGVMVCLYMVTVLLKEGQVAVAAVWHAPLSPSGWAGQGVFQPPRRPQASVSVRVPSSGRPSCLVRPLPALPWCAVYSWRMLLKRICLAFGEQFQWHN